MINKIKEFRESLNEDYIINKREYILTLIVCTLGGVLFGLLTSPRKYSVIGSYNGFNDNRGLELDDCEDELEE